MTLKKYLGVVRDYVRAEELYNKTHNERHKQISDTLFRLMRDELKCQLRRVNEPYEATEPKI